MTEKTQNFLISPASKVMKNKQVQVTTFCTGNKKRKMSSPVFPTAFNTEECKDLQFNFGKFECKVEKFTFCSKM